MGKIIQRAFSEPLREGLSWDDKWKSDDNGLIKCWEVGREIRDRDPELAAKAENGELPPLGWKGGVAKAVKQKKKIGTLNYLAQWQGLRGEDLNIDLGSEPQLTCTHTDVSVTFTGDLEKYANAE